jgi:hypothetical protein
MPDQRLLKSTSSRKAVATASLFPLALSAASLFAQPAQAQNLCTILGGGLIDCEASVPPVPGTPPTTGTIDLTGASDPLVVTLADGFVSNGPLNLGTLAGADIDIVSNGLTTISNSGSGLVANSGGAINANITNISTSADGAAGVLLDAADQILFTSDGTIRTIGANAPGVAATGSSIVADLNLVQTEGPSAAGVQLVSTDGPISLDFDTIETDGDLSDATILRGTGDVGLRGSALRTNGTDAIAFDISTDAAACILLGAGGCDVTTAVEEVTTQGFGGIGGLVAGNGDTNVDIGVLRTGGDEAAGLDLSSNPATCVTLGVGACDTAFTVGDLSTAGNRSPGAIVRGSGDTSANVGVLRTGGSEAAGLDLASDPNACAVLGQGACDTSFSVGQLTTEGAGSTGVLVRSAGDTTGNIGVLRTGGEDAAGVDIAGDPTACVLLGAGACDVGLAADLVSTAGSGAAAVLISTIGDVTTNLGLVSTDGDNSTGLGIVTAPAACLALGPGACTVNAAADEVDTGGDNSPGVEVVGGPDPVVVDVGTVTTGGDDSPAVAATGSGPVDVTAGTVTTDGDNSPGIDASSDGGPVDVDFTSVTTAGTNSPGIIAAGEGAIDITGGAVATSGPGSDGVLVDGGAGPVRVDVGAVTTSGADSDGIDVSTTTGAQTILAGPVIVTGAGSDGIVATAGGCGNIGITARDDIVSSQGSAILASSQCAVSVTTLPGASIAGATAGIDVTSGTGATITIGDAVSSTGGFAIDADGAGAAIAVQTGGSLNGRIDLTDNADTLDNAGIFAPVGASAFGGGTDVLTNRGTIRVRQVANFAGLESLVNNGVIDMGDGAADDVLTTSGAFTGGTGSRLMVDVAAGTAGTPADRLVIGGAASGTTAVTVNLLGGPAVANPTGVVIVDAASQGNGTFALSGPLTSGFVDYSLANNASGDTLLVATPNALALQPLLLPGLAQSFWYHSADAWSESVADLRSGAAAAEGTHVWGQFYASSEKSGKRRNVDVFGTATAADLRADTDRLGGQAAVGFGTGSGAVLGITGGYQKGNTDFASATHINFHGWNLGAYALYSAPSGFYGEALAKVDWFDGRIRNGTLFGDGKLSGTSYGAEGKAGFRTTRGPVYFDLNAGLAYVRTELDSLAGAGGSFDFDNDDSLRVRLGARIGGTGTGLAPYADVKLFHELAGSHDSRFNSGGFALPLSDEAGTSVRGEVGLAGNAGRAGLHLSVWGQVGDVRGYGLRLGLRF